MKNLKTVLAAGILVFSVGALASCGDSQYENDKLNEVVMTGPFAFKGGGKITLTLQKNGVCVFDVTCNEAPSPVFQTAFDRTGTYTVKDGVYTFVIQHSDLNGNAVGDPWTYTSEWNEEEGKHHLLYKMPAEGGAVLESPMVGKLTK